MTIQELIVHLDNPQIYTGREINSIHHPLEDILARRLINVCLVFPDKYEIGMSHYGLIVLYHLLNALPGVNAERCFLPGRESIPLFKEHQVPLFSLESKTPLHQFDLIAFSLLSEMNFTNILQVLDLAGIPIRSDERQAGGSFPLIALGGISAINPEPVRDFIDFFGIGDGEELFPDIIATLKLARRQSLKNRQILELLDGVPGIYVPALHPPLVKGSFCAPFQKVGVLSKRVHQQFRAEKKGRYSPPTDTDATRWIVPITSVVFDRLTIELARGCPKNCRFCQAKSYYAPYRTRSLENVTSALCNGLAVTGFEAFSLSSLSSGDYPHLTPLLESIPDMMGDGVSFSLPSLRPSTLSHHLLSTIALFKRTGLTIVPEAGTTRLRNVINKDVSDEEIYKAVEMALFNRWEKIKLYFMLGLPTETMEDIQGIVLMIQKIMEMARAARQKVSIHASFSSFVPKPQTPLQWAAREDLSGIIQKIKIIKEQLKPLVGRNLNLDFHAPETGVVETILARGDYRVGQLVEQAFRHGQIFASWENEFDYRAWEELIENSPHRGVYYSFLQEFSLTEFLPWDFIRVNFKKEYLQAEYQKALAGLPTPACAQKECPACLGCFQPLSRGSKGVEPETLVASAPVVKAKRGGEVPYRKVRLIYEKTGYFTYFSHLTMIKYLERLIRRTGMRFRCTEGFTSRIKLTSLPALPVFATGLFEVVELFLDAALEPGDILKKLKKSADPEGFVFKEVFIADHVPPLPRDLHFFDFEILLPEALSYREAVEGVLAGTDALSFDGDLMFLTMDYAHGGQERFAKLYKIIDPEKKNTMNLTRTHVTFKH